MSGDASTSAPDDVLAPLLDLLVHLPVGLYLDSKGRLDEIVERGRSHTASHVQLARTIGQFAVTFGRKEVERRLADFFAGHTPSTDAPPPEPSPPPTAAAPATASPAGGAGSPGGTGSTPRTDRSTNRPSGSAGARPTPGAAARKRAASLPIDGYDTLAASQIIARLDGLTAKQLAAVRRHEAGTRNRKTILGRIDQLTGG